MPVVDASVPVVTGVGDAVVSVLPVEPGPAPLLLCAASLVPSAMDKWDKPNAAPTINVLNKLLSFIFMFSMHRKRGPIRFPLRLWFVRVRLSGIQRSERTKLPYRRQLVCYVPMIGM